VDFRERFSSVPALIEEKGIPIKFELLEVGDYLISEKYIVERKTAQDFVSSLFDGRLFEQCRRIQKSHRFPLLLLEGNPFNLIALSQRSRIRAALVAINAGWQIPVVYSSSKEESAAILHILVNQQIKRRRQIGRKVSL